MRSTSRGTPVALTILADVVAAALLLSVFYVTNYMITPDVQGVPLSTPSTGPDFTASLSLDTPVPTTGDPSATVGDEPTAVPTDGQQTETPATTQAPALPGMFRAKFADKFTSGAIEKTDTSYKSANVNVSYEKKQENGVTYFVADIYVADIKCFKTGFGTSDKPGPREFVSDTLKANGGIVGINGDNILHNPGLLIRNGLYYRNSKTTSDVLVMYNDGTMKTIPGGQFDANKVKAEAPYQVWAFGPMLLNNGQPMMKFNSTVSGLDPRTAVGYYEPGHYCFVFVEGRLSESKGYSLVDFSSLFYKLGCKEAYNFDGGGTSQMAFMGNQIGQQCSDARKADDLLYIADN